MQIVPISYVERQYKWTVAFVNYKSVDFLIWQLATLYNLNDPNEFELLIFDSMFPRNQREQLEKICAKYAEHGNIKLFFYDNRHERRGVAHGHELNYILKEAKGKYFLSNDPDYFWAIKGHLNFLESYFDQGYGSVGVRHNVQIGPAIWGGAWETDIIRGHDAQAVFVSCPKCHDRILAKGYDTGWQFHFVSKHLPVKIFEPTPWKPPFFGQYSYEAITGETEYSSAYTENDEIIGAHLFRGAYHHHILTRTEIPVAWKRARNMYGQFFYEKACGRK
jgi:hypothetical protein